LEALANYRFIFDVPTISARRLKAPGGRVYPPMTSNKTTGFRKNETCPTSNELLEFQKGGIAAKRRSEVLTHTERCEFCAAELELYFHYPQQEGETERVESVAIPAPLFQLAEALLRKKHSDPSSLDVFLLEPPPITST
jgi:hypothetical protein